MIVGYCKPGPGLSFEKKATSKYASCERSSTSGLRLRGMEPLLWKLVLHLMS